MKQKILQAVHPLLQQQQQQQQQQLVVQRQRPPQLRRQLLKALLNRGMNMIHRVCNSILQWRKIQFLL